MWLNATPALSSRPMADRWETDPFPPLPTFIAPACVFAAMRNSSTVFHGASARTVMAAGSAFRRAIGSNFVWSNLAKAWRGNVLTSAVNMHSLWPSGRLPSTSFIPTTPLAPGLLFTTKDCWGRCFLAASAKTPANASVPPPAAAGTMISIGALGHPSAEARATTKGRADMPSDCRRCRRRHTARLAPAALADMAGSRFLAGMLLSPWVGCRVWPFLSPVAGSVAPIGPYWPLLAPALAARGRSGHDQHQSGAECQAGRQEEHGRDRASGAVFDPWHCVLGDEASQVADGVDGGQSGRCAGAFEKARWQAPENRHPREDAGRCQTQEHELQRRGLQQRRQQQAKGPEECRRDDVGCLRVGMRGRPGNGVQTDGHQHPRDHIEQPVVRVADAKALDHRGQPIAQSVG